VKKGPEGVSEIRVSVPAQRSTDFWRANVTFRSISVYFMFSNQIATSYVTGTTSASSAYNIYKTT